MIYRYNKSADEIRAMTDEEYSVWCAELKEMHEEVKRSNQFIMKWVGIGLVILLCVAIAKFII
jgi:uncharacterized membrane protein YukC